MLRSCLLQSEPEKHERTGLKWSSLLLLLLAAFFLEPFFGSGRFVGITSSLIFVVTMVGASFFARMGRTVCIAQCAVAAIWMLFVLFEGSNRQIHAIAAFSSFALVISASAVTFWHLLHAKRYDADLLYGAIFGYLLIAMSFAFVFYSIERWSPGSFLLATHTADWASFLYFSLVTITTLGYGEISPLHPFARILAALEAVIGVMYVAVLIGAIVGAYRNRRFDS